MGIIFILGIIVLMIASSWTLNTKAGQPGWACLIPIYSTLVHLDIIEKPRWWIFMMLLPLVNLVFAIWALNLFVKKFGKSEAWTVGCIFLPFIFYPMMAFDDNVQYIGSTSNQDNMMNERHKDLLDHI